LGLAGGDFKSITGLSGRTWNSILVTPNHSYGRSSIGSLDPNDPILHMEEKIDPQDPAQAVKDGVKKAAENLHASAEAKGRAFQDAAENAWSDA
jgi:hypothetical protein